MSGEITELLIAWSDGRREAADEVFRLVYDELRRLARGQRRAGYGHDLTTTELVHEAYVKLIDASRVSASSRAHFFSLAARAMRQILVDAARRGNAAKRGGGAVAAELDDAALSTTAEPTLVLGVDAALGKLAVLDPRMGQIVELRVFAGLSVDEVAQALEVSPRTVKRDWRAARAFLYRELEAAS
ncbi:MAG: ECF-type sigma factor [Acidobacteriota bacterium]